MVALLPMFPIRHTKLPVQSLRVSHGRSGPVFFKTWFLNNNTIALLNPTTKAGNLRRDVVLPPPVWLAFEGVGFSIHGCPATCAAQIAFALHSSTNLALAFAVISHIARSLSYWVKQLQRKVIPNNALILYARSLSPSFCLSQ